MSIVGSPEFGFVVVFLANGISLSDEFGNYKEGSYRVNPKTNLYIADPVDMSTTLTGHMTTKLALTDTLKRAMVFNQYNDAAIMHEVYMMRQTYFDGAYNENKKVVGNVSLAPKSIIQVRKTFKVTVDDVVPTGEDL
jgi:hypothetical protein